MERNNPNMCPNCFDSGYRNGECGRCGYQAKFDRHISIRGLAAGNILKNRYYIGKILGEGGFGITYKAYDFQRRMVCAIKEYVPNGMSRRAADGRRIEITSPDIEEPYYAGLKRFLDESQILIRLGQIPSVVNITDSFQENSTAYFVMEYLDGLDLGQLIRNGKNRPSVGEVTNYILQVAVSMDIIHTKTRIIHRDISPDNIFITKNKQAKLIDFGSAKQIVSGAQDGFSVVVRLKFSPPEQYSKAMLQGSFTDVYSLAATYYYALTGNNLPTAPDRLSGGKYVPLKQLNIGVPDCVSDAVDRALILNIEQRTRTMQEFIQGIAPGAGGQRPSINSYEAEQLARQREEFRRQEAARQQAEKERQLQAKRAWEQQQKELARQREQQQAQKRQQEAARQREQQLAQQRQQEAARQREQQLAQQRQQEAARQREQQAQKRQQELMRQRELVHQQKYPRRPAVRAGGSAEQNNSGLPYITVVSGPVAGKHWVIPPNQVMKIGRSETEVHLRIEKPGDLSRIHCTVTYAADKNVFRVRDLSSYGVFYQGKRLEKGKDYEFKPPVRLALASPACIIEAGMK